MSRHVVISGSNRGIGLALCRCFIEHGDRVSALCRAPTDELQALPVQVLTGCDVSQPDAIEQLVAQLAGEPIDILINNAGILSSESLASMDFDAITRQFAVNALGPLRLVTALQSQLREGSKVAMITSRMGSIADNSSGGYYGYRMSKAALNCAGMSLARDLAPRGISVAMIHPGMVQTEMVNYAGDISAGEAARRIASRIEQMNLDNTGSFWHANGEDLPW